MPSLFVRDGWTLTTTLPGLKGVYPPLKVWYRPALPERVQEFLQAPKPNAKASLAALIDLLCDQLVKWDACDENGLPVPVARPLLETIHLPILQKLGDAVTGYGAADFAAAEGN